MEVQMTTLDCYLLLLGELTKISLMLVQT